jgi:hypothetical protein
MLSLKFITKQYLKLNLMGIIGNTYMYKEYDVNGYIF